jgi:ribosomal RNA-processing protein 17
VRCAADHRRSADEDEDDDEGLSLSGDDMNQEVMGEYEGDEQLATVTVVEDFDPDALLHGPPTTGSAHTDPLDTPSHTLLKSKGKERAHNDRSKPKSKAKKNGKTKSIRYQTKAERLAERSKQRARRTEKAERAGGKFSKKGKRR